MKGKLSRTTDFAELGKQVYGYQIFGSNINSGVLKALSKGWITTEDVVEIIGGKDVTAVAKAAKQKEISE